MRSISEWFSSRNKPVQSVITPDVIHKFNNSEMAVEAVRRKAEELKNATTEFERTVVDFLSHLDKVTGRKQ